MSKELAKPDSGQLVNSLAGETEMPRVYTSLDPTDPHNIPILYRARQAADKTLQECVNVALTLKHLLRHKVADVDPTTAEVKEWNRWVLITDDDTTISTGSSPVEGDILTLISILGPPPWEPGPIVTPVYRVSKRNAQMKYIQLQVDDKQLVSLMEKRGKKK